MLEFEFGSYESFENFLNKDNLDYLIQKFKEIIYLGLSTVIVREV